MRIRDVSWQLRDQVSANRKASGGNIPTKTIFNISSAPNDTILLFSCTCVLKAETLYRLKPLYKCTLISARRKE